MLELMRGLGYEATFEEAWKIVADDDLCERYYNEADARVLEYQRGQLITMLEAMQDKHRVKGQKNRFD